MFPSFFMAHGAPTLVLEHNPYTRFLRILGAQIPKPRGVVLFSAHWESPVQAISGAAQPETIHDFFGYPQRLYQYEYVARGDILLSLEVQKLLTAEGIGCRIHDERGLDHGAWTVLSLLLPHADVPVVTLSVNPRLVPEEQYRIGMSLMPLREQDYLIIGSGGTVHNPGLLGWDAKEADNWAIEFDQWLAERIHIWDLEALFEYERRAPFAADAAPTREHLAPLFIGMGAADVKRKAALLHQQYQYGSLSLSCWMFS
ncbi:DODA-type extradiol aromatic ring-opening family dioxygenase [Paenibacillus piri]|uniref:Dioxygenase n=1 Tax=Paenibacillus piri TaxID=2547395 RepID=A0A4R5KL09_9BACL|nr:class III extradiol ring-cleavage dioxygenase [Paenibacillus piri]TDF95528.1 dioxygenase [Paenibacillus piri]